MYTSMLQQRTVWLALLVCCAAVSNASAVGPPTASGDLRSKEVEELIRRYFRTWSNEDMPSYSKCFHKNACVQYIDAKGDIDHKSLPAFLATQAAAFRRNDRATETPESIDIRFEQNLARAVVRWKLILGAKTISGYDHFTLSKTEGKWGIVNLVFYEISPGE
jgi:pyroglutamyl-peptidase